LFATIRFKNAEPEGVVMENRNSIRGLVVLSLCVAHCYVTPAGAGPAGNIRALDQHFNHPGADVSRWMFLPRANIKDSRPRSTPVWRRSTKFLIDYVRYRYGLSTPRQEGMGR
jgi:hypothetical protein